MTAAEAPARRQGRSTSQRAAVTALLNEVGEFRSAQNLHSQLVDRGAQVSLTTVYRTLATLASEEAVDVVLTAHGETLYRKCSTGHHHHLVCRGCGRTVEVSGEGVEAWAAQIAAQHGFSNVSHVVEVFGDCSDCR
ncbi:MAG: Fur family transcriptional regulator [Segniliparus sp.]|uniref:Fur family transcriptional regulator n=1 Tax=Segniliparus sp. TaxID=2804064 RepID=UPI003F3D43F6